MNNSFCMLQIRCLSRISDTYRTVGKPKGPDSGLGKAYSPRPVEADWYGFWEESGQFQPKHVDNRNKLFSMILPPPNVTGSLHLGHAVTVTIQDALARWSRMNGKSVAWIPGTDHAGIATQVVVEKLLKQQMNKTRHDLGQEKFIEEVWKWKKEKGNRISKQLRELGASVDWTREYFTMDKKQSDAVSKALVTLWDAGLVYRSESLVNWSCDLLSAISDIEVEHVPVSGPTHISVPGYDKPVTFGQLVNFAYRLTDNDDEIIVSTTRVETMLGDVAVAVHPNDSRYSHLIGKKLLHSINGNHIPIIPDESVNPEFGTGAVKVTPAHNQTDFLIAKRHNLPFVSVIKENGHMTDSCGQFSNMKRFEAREQVLNFLSSSGLLRGINDHDMQVPICSRSGDVVELLVKPQWFLDCKQMAQKAASAVRDGSLVIEPNEFADSWYSWLDNIRDWCISRQLWWGHRLPLYRCSSDGLEVYVGAINDKEAAEKAQKHLVGEITLERESDVLDTWFSSALLPFTAFGWPGKAEISNGFPLDIMVTGHDIMFFWVARMVMLGSFFTGKLPFKKVLLHGIVCDSQGRKMSKSRGNVIDPEDIIYGASLDDLKKRISKNRSDGLISSIEEIKAMAGLEEQFPQGIPECGRDALRFTLLTYKIKSHYMNFNVTDCYSNRLFCNKIWQACRFSSDWSKKLSLEFDTSSDPDPRTIMDKWILSQLSSAVDTINSAIPNGDFNKATVAIRQFLYSEFCDVYLEYCKPILRGLDEESKNVCRILLYCLETGLKCMAPFMPYLAEELYLHLPGKRLASVMFTEYPKNLKWSDPVLKEKMDFLFEIVAEIRRLKQSVKKNPTVWLLTDDSELQNKLHIIKTLVRCENVTICTNLPSGLKSTVSAKLMNSTEIHIPVLESKQDTSKIDLENSLKKKEKLENELKKLMIMMSNKGYEVVPLKVKQAHTDKISQIEHELNKLNKLLA